MSSQWPPEETVDVQPLNQLFPHLTQDAHTIVGTSTDTAVLGSPDSDNMDLSRILHPVHISAQSTPANINDMANEILTIIFRLCVDGGSWEMRRKEAPLLLTRVCSRWRRIVINTPSLWAKLSFFIIKAPPPNLAQRVSDVWLSRLGTSGHLDLSLKVNRMISDNSDRFRVGRFLNDLLCRYHPLTPRLQSLALSDVFLERSEGQVLFTELPLIQLTNLRHFTLETCRSPSPMLEWVFSLLPNLQLNNVIWNETRVQAFLRTAPLAHLTSLEFESTLSGFPIWRDDLQKLFQEAPQLTTLSLTFANPTSPVDTNPPATSAIVHNRLRVFRVGVSMAEDGTSVMPNTFDHITLPALEDFQINASPLISDWEADSMVNFLKRSRCNLTKFTLDPPPRIEDITECLEIESIETHLTGLHISNSNWAEQENWITQDSEDPKVLVMLPLLEYLTTTRRVGDVERLPLPLLEEMSVWIDPYTDMETLAELVDQRFTVFDTNGAVVPPDTVNGPSYLKQLTIVAVVEQKNYRNWTADTGFRDYYIKWLTDDQELELFVDDFVSKEVEEGWKLGMKETWGLPKRPDDDSLPDEDDNQQFSDFDEEEEFAYTDHEMDSDDD